MLIPWAALRGQCGWSLRLSSKVIEAAVVALARLRLLPDSHPGHRMLRLADGTVAPTWASKVRELMAERDLPSPIADITDHPAFTRQQLDLARSSREDRKLLLKRYRQEVVRPPLQQRDVELFHASAAARVHFAPWTLLDLMPEPTPPPFELLSMDWGSKTWPFYRMWAIVRLSGAWPFSPSGGHGFPRVLDSCPACGSGDGTVCHLLCACPATRSFVADLMALECVTLKNWQGDAFIYWLFAETTSEEERSHQIRFVGRSCCLALAGLRESAQT